MYYTVCNLYNVHTENKVYMQIHYSLMINL